MTTPVRPEDVPQVNTWYKRLLNNPPIVSAFITELILLANYFNWISVDEAGLSLIVGVWVALSAMVTRAFAWGPITGNAQANNAEFYRQELMAP